MKMNFKQAFALMKKGLKVKLPSWGGYWYWDAEKETIMMRCRTIDSDTGKELLDIRETQRVEYTLLNILSDEWVVATEENTTVLGGTPTFSFGDAIKYMKRGLKVRRKGWNGKNQYIELARNISYMEPDGVVQNCDHEAIGNQAIAFVGTSGVQMGWLASQADMLADDWIFAEQERQVKDMTMWLKKAGVRAIKTVAQAAVAMIGTAAVVQEVDWKMVAGAAVLAGILSLLTSLAGLPELDTEAAGESLETTEDDMLDEEDADALIAADEAEAEELKAAGKQRAEGMPEQ